MRTYTVTQHATQKVKITLKVKAECPAHARELLEEGNYDTATVIETEVMDEDGREIVDMDAGDDPVLAGGLVHHSRFDVDGPDEDAYDVVETSECFEVRQGSWTESEHTTLAAAETEATRLAQEYEA